MYKLMNLWKLRHPTSEAQAEPEQETAAPPVTETEPKTVDINAVIADAIAKGVEVAEKKKPAVMKSVIEQNGYKYDDATIKKLIEEYEAKQPNPEKLLQEEREAKAALEKEKEQLTQKLAAAEKGIPADKIDKYISYAKGIMTEGKAFTDAIDEVLKDIPINKPPAMASGTGTKSLGANDPFIQGIEMAKKRKF